MMDLKQIEELNPRLILVDLDVSGGGGLSTLATLRAWQPDLPILVLSLESNEIYRQAAHAAGAQGLIPKATLSSLLLPAIRQALEVH
jgi:DNA-binding NarL/FixJ family response regulator